MRIGEALRELRGGEKQGAVAARAQRLAGSGQRITQDDLSKFENGVRVPSYDQLAAIEVALGAKRGAILIRCGYVEGVCTVEQALAGDTSLAPDDRRVVLRVYRGLAGAR